MRIVLTIFCVAGVIAVGLVVFVITGVMHLSSMNNLGVKTTVQVAATQPSVDPDDAADAPTTNADPPPPPTVEERTISVAPLDAQLTGPRVAIFARNNQVLRTALNTPPTDLPAYGKRGLFKHSGPQKAMPEAFVGRFDTPNDRAEWTIDSPLAATYDLNLIYCAPKWARGTLAPLQITIGSEELSFDPKPTANEGFEMAEVGQVHLPQGRVTLAIKSQRKTNRNDRDEPLLRLREIVLLPSDQQ